MNPSPWKKKNLQQTSNQIQNQNPRQIPQKASLPLKKGLMIPKGLWEVYVVCLSTCQVIILSMLLTDQ